MKLPTITIIPGTTKLTFDDMPLWRGVQKSPGLTCSLPFVIVAEVGGQIKQILSESITDRVISEYKSDDYNFITPPPGSSEWANSLGERNVKIIKGAIRDKYPKHILEIGGGTTWVSSKLMKLFRPNSYYAIDPALQATNEKLNIIRDYFPTSKLKEKDFDLIVGFNVLEHVEDPLNFLKNIWNVLAEEGTVILTFPDCKEQFGKGDINVLIHEHLSYFTEESVIWVTKSADFEIVSLDSKNDLFTLVIEKTKKTFNLKNKNINETKLLQNSAEMFKNLLDNVAGKIKSFLEGDHKLAFHGATHGLNTFFHITGLGDHPNISIYDGDKSKVGMYLPASSIPIKHCKERSYKENTMIIISAMSFYHQIRGFAISTGQYSDRQIIPLVADVLV